MTSNSQSPFWLSIGFCGGKLSFCASHGWQQKEARWPSKKHGFGAAWHHKVAFGMGCMRRHSQKCSWWWWVNRGGEGRGHQGGPGQPNVPSASYYQDVLDPISSNAIGGSFAVGSWSTLLEEQTGANTWGSTRRGRHSMENQEVAYISQNEGPKTWSIFSALFYCWSVAIRSFLASSVGLSEFPEVLVWKR